MWCREAKPPQQPPRARLKSSPMRKRLRSGDPRPGGPLPNPTTPARVIFTREVPPTRRRANKEGYSLASRCTGERDAISSPPLRPSASVEAPDERHPTRDGHGRMHFRTLHRIRCHGFTSASARESVPWGEWRKGLRRAVPGVFPLPAQPSGSPRAPPIVKIGLSVISGSPCARPGLTVATRTPNQHR